jgi:hypothetical protein
MSGNIPSKHRYWLANHESLLNCRHWKRYERRNIFTIITNYMQVPIPTSMGLTTVVNVQCLVGLHMAIYPATNTARRRHGGVS